MSFLHTAKEFALLLVDGNLSELHTIAIGVVGIGTQIRTSDADIAGRLNWRE